jgi:hypothetical protein
LNSNVCIRAIRCRVSYYRIRYKRLEKTR